MFATRRAVALCTVAVMLLAAGACSKGDSSSDLATKDPKAAMAQAAKRTAEAKTVRIALSATSSTKVRVLSGTGAYDFTSERGRINLKTTVGAGADAVITRDDVYLKVPKKQKPTDPGWIRVTPADVQASGGQLSQFVSSLQSVDPRRTLDAIGTKVPDLTRVGKQKVRGTDTTHLRGRVDLSDKAIAAAPESQRDELKSAQDVFGPDGYPVDIWLDGDGRVRRIEYKVTSGSGESKTTTTVRLDLYDFGKTPHIKLPDSSDVGDASTLLNATSTTAAK